MGPVQPIEMPGLDRFQLRIENATNVPQLMPPSITIETAPQPTVVVSPTGALPPSPRASPRASPRGNHNVKAMYNFDAATSEELSFKVGEEFTVTSDPGGGWLRVLSKTGQQGLIPSNYVVPL